MLKMIEITERSEKGFSEAVTAGIEGLISSGKKVHFFEVIEQRGSVKNNKIQEFQVIVKVAIEE